MLDLVQWCSIAGAALGCAFANWTVFIDVKNIKPE
jgi:hypothetical protein